MSQRPPEPSNADIAAWPSKKLSVRRSTTRLAACSLPIATLARWVLGVRVIGAAMVYRHLTQGLSTAPCTGTYTGYSQPDPTISTAIHRVFPLLIQRFSTACSPQIHT